VVPQVVPLVVLEAQVQVLELQDEHVFRWTQRVALEVQAQAKLSEFVLLPHKNLHGLGLQAHRTLQEQGHMKQQELALQVHRTLPEQVHRTLPEQAHRTLQEQAHRTLQEQQLAPQAQKKLQGI